jgi:microprocessor complex subunit DGCR8
MPLSAIPCLSYRKALMREAALSSKAVAENQEPSDSLPEVKSEPSQEPEMCETLTVESVETENPASENSSMDISLQSEVVSDPVEVDRICPFVGTTSTVEVPAPPATDLKSAASIKVTADDELEPGEIQDDDDTVTSDVSMSGNNFGEAVNTEESSIKVEGDSQAVGTSEQDSKVDPKQSPRVPSTPIHQRLKLFMEEKHSNVFEPPTDAVKNMIPKAQVETSQEANELNSVNPEELREYCMRLFKFKQFTCKRFKSWRDRRKHTKEQKRLHLQRPTLPEGVQLITFPVQRPAGESDSGKAIKEYTMNPQGKSSVCILHEYVQHALRMQPSYTFGEIRNSASPYAATVMINNVKYGIGYGTSKKLAKAAAAAATLEILIPEMKDVLKTSGAANNELYHIGYFDQVEMDDPRIPKMCASVSEPSPYALLLACLQRNFGQGSTSDIKFDVISTNGQANRFKMQTGEHCVEVTASNKREGKQLASQALLCKIHPHIKNFGSFLRLYGNGSIKSVKEKKQEEQQITTLQSKASANSPNYAILNKLKEEMLKLREKRAQSSTTQGLDLVEVVDPV